MTSNNKFNTGNIFDILLRISWALLIFAIRTLTEFLDIKSNNWTKILDIFCFIHFLAENKRKLTIFTVSIEEIETSIINL